MMSIIDRHQVDKYELHKENRRLTNLVNQLREALFLAGAWVPTGMRAISVGRILKL